MKKLYALGALGALMVVAGAAYAARGFGGGHMKYVIGARVAEMEDFINATPQQRQVIDGARDNIVNALQSRGQEGKQQHQALIQALTGDNFDAQSLYNLADQHANQIRDLAKTIVPELQKVHDVLTPAQRQQLAQKMAAGRHQQ